MNASPPTPRDVLATLVAFDTTSRRSNLALIDYCADFLAGHGVASERVANADGTKANLIASIGPAVAGGIVLSGHTDVVPVDGQKWDTDPFTMVERSGRLYGRGTTDMKGFLAVALSLVPEFLARGLRVPIHLAFSYDEEVGCLGAPGLLERLTARLPRPLGALIGEPTRLRAVNAHRGVRIYRTSVRGRPGHASATHKGVSAVAYAAECVAFLGRLADEMRDRADKVSDFDPPYTTINVGRIDGGSAVNVIAPECHFDWECRTLPGGDGGEVARRLAAYCDETLAPRMHAVAPEAGIVTEETAAIPAFRSAPDSAIEALILRLTGENRAHPVQFASEAGMFEEAGIPAVICGPGDPDMAHRADEYVALADLEACAALLRRIADWAADG